MNERLIIDAKMCQNINISQLKNVGFTPNIDEMVQSKDIEKIKTILNMIADDLLNIYQKDYTTTLVLTITNFDITINLTKGYPFHYKYSRGDGIIKNIYHCFNFNTCSNEKVIRKILDDSINIVFQEQQPMAKHYSVIAEKQNFYLNLKKIDQLLFGENKLFKKFSYIDSTYACDRHQTHKIGHIEASLQVDKDQCIAYISFGKLMLSVSKNGVIIRKKVGITKYEMLHHYDTYRLDPAKIEENFVSYYNFLYDKDYTKIADIVLIEDMIAI